MKRTRWLLRWLGIAQITILLFLRSLPAETGNESPGFTKVPDFVLRKCVLADSLHLADFSNQPVLLFFFDAGDISCRRAYPYLNEWHRRYENDGLKVIAIHCPGYEPLKKWENAATAVGRANLKIPVGMDWSCKVYEAFGLRQLPTFLLLRPGLEPVLSVSSLRSFREIEIAIQNLLKEIKPGTILPFLLEPLKPEDNPKLKLYRSTPKIDLGYQDLKIANCDSSDFGRFAAFTDPGERTREVVFLDGRWRIDENSVTCEPDRSYPSGRLRVLYSGKSVWLLADYPKDKPPRIYVKQDRSYLPSELWGNDIRFDELGRPFILIRYAVPVHVVENTEHGAHQLELLIEDGVVTFYYLFFESAVER